MTLAVAQIILVPDDAMIDIYWTGQFFGRKKSLFKLRHYTGVTMEGLKRTTKDLRKDSIISAEIRTGYLPNTSQQCHRLNELARLI
jgi:hypothetical protein